MKTSERHRLKTNEVAESIARTREMLVERQGAITAALIVTAIVLVGVAGYFGQRSRTQNRAGAMLGDALAVLNAPVQPPVDATGTSPPPTPGMFMTETARSQAAIEKLMAAANAYPSTKAGLLARYQAAVQMVALGRLVDAEQQYLELSKLDPTGLYGKMSRLGLADLQVRAGNHEQAIATFRDAVDRPDADLPLDGVLMQLARAYSAAGRSDEAKAACTRIIDEFPQSAYVTEARRVVDTLATPAQSS
jgi:TolA-binding protein